MLGFIQHVTIGATTMLEGIIVTDFRLKTPKLDITRFLVVFSALKGEKMGSGTTQLLEVTLNQHFISKTYLL